MLSLHKAVGLLLISLLAYAKPGLTQSQTPAAKKTTLVFATANWCPYICDPAHDKLARRGYMIDLLDSIFRDSNYNIEITMRAYPESIAMAKAGKVDGIIGTLPLDAPELIYPSLAIGIGTDIFVTRPNSSWTYETPSSLETVRLGTVEGYEYESLKNYKKKFAASDRLQPLATGNGVNTTLRNLQKLFKHEIDVVLDNSEVINFTNTVHKLPISRLAGQLEDPYALWLALSPESSHWQAICKLQNQRLNELRKSGALDFMLRRYGLQDWQKNQLDFTQQINLPGIRRCD